MALLKASEGGPDPDGLAEFSVVYTDRALNHMSRRFQGIMTGLSTVLKRLHRADAVVVVPGSGTYAMEAVARAFAAGRRCLVLRNGWFSFRWSQILDGASLALHVEVLKARRASPSAGVPAQQTPFAPAPLAEVVEAIRRTKPQVVFAPHVETSSGIMLPDDYLRSVAAAVHDVGGIFVLDCIASGAVFVDMQAVGVDVVIAAPQKSYSGPACCGLVYLRSAAVKILDAPVDPKTTPIVASSFALDLRKWLAIMRAYEQGGHMYHATMPTDALATFRDRLAQLEKFGFEKAQRAQFELGRRVRQELVRRGYPSVAAEGFQSPGVVVSYTTDEGIKSGKKFAEQGMQIAAGVPLQCDEEKAGPFNTFRLGLFGVDKFANIDQTVAVLCKALDKVQPPRQSKL